MAKELPYYRFHVSEWLNDDISFMDYSVKGVFIDICSMYWFKDCSITKAMLEQRLINAKDELEQLYNNDIIKLNPDDTITIKFLDEQYDKLSEKRKKRSEAGRKGGLKKSSNAKAMLKQSSSYKDKDKDKEKDKDKDSETKVSFIPTLEEVKDYFNEKGYSLDVAERAYNMYNASLEDNPKRKYWRDSRDNVIKNWKLKMQSVWFKDENKATPKTKRNNGRERESILDLIN